MATDSLTFAGWLHHSAVVESTLTAPQRAFLEAAWRFLEPRGHDYFSRRLLSHVLLHAQTGLKVAQIARLLGFSRSAASAQQGLSSKEVIQATHHRLVGPTHSKLLPCYAGPIAQFLLEQPQATRWDLLDFIHRTWNVSVSRMALHRFLKKYGLEQTGRVVALRPLAPAATTDPGPADPPPAATTAGSAPPLILATTDASPPGSVTRPPPDFFLPPPSTQVPSCSCPKPSTGSPSPATASPMTTARCSAAC
jgi:hypothetical protein